MQTIKKSTLKILAAGTDCKQELLDILKGFSYMEVSEAADGVTAWHFLKQKTVDIVFADWALGQFDGLVLLKIMMADSKLCSIPVVLMCSTINREMVIDAGHAGVSGIMVRPFNAETVEEKIKGLFAILEDREKDMQAEKLLEAGSVYMQQGAYEKAIESFNKVLGLYENPEVYYNIGYIKASQKRYDESITAFRKAISIDQKFAKAYQALGEVYLKIGLNTNAEEMMQRAGEIYMEKNMTKEAETAFHEVLKLNPNTTNIYNSLGILYRRNRDFPSAIRAYEKALCVDPEDENIFFNLGRACFEAGLVKRARMYLQRALELYPEFTEAQTLLEQLSTEKGS